MSRSPTPWLSEGTAPNRTAAHAISILILSLNQLQPGGCTQLHHLNEDVPLRAAVRASPSWWHRRTPTYLRPSAMSSNGTYKHQNSGVSGLLESGRAKRKTAQDGAYLASAPSLRIGGEALSTMNFVLAHCPRIVGMAPARPHRQTMRSSSHAPSPSHSLFSTPLHSER